MIKGSRPSRKQAIVVGGGISGLVAARELAMAGFAVTVLEARNSWGGCVGSHEVGGLVLDSGAESFATRSTAVAELAGELGLAGAIVLPRPGGAWVQLPDGARELPKTGVLGIPANPWDPEVRRTLGFAGSLRASLDRWLPASYGATHPLTSVAELVRKRMGRRVLDRLVAPVVGGVHSADPGLLDVDMVAPGLREAQANYGSLAAAVAAQRKASARRQGPTAQEANGQETVAPATRPGSAVAGLKGGMHTLVSALVSDLQSHGVVLKAGSRAESLSRHDGAWRVRAAGKDYDAGKVAIALDGPAAVGLLENILPALTPLRPEPGPQVKLVTLVVDMPELDSRPRGTGILVAPQSPGIQAKALTHATGKWDWLSAEAGPGTHVLRLSYGRHAGGDSDPHSPGRSMSAGLSDEELRDAALHDASTLLQVPITANDVLDWDVICWEGALPFAAVGHRQRVAQVRRIFASVEGLVVVGGWLAGNGLASVVADTRQQITRLIPPLEDTA